MKKNLIILISALSIMFLWIIIRSLIITTSVSKVMAGKPTKLAYKIVDDKTSLKPFKILVIKTPGNIDFTVKKGDEYRMENSKELNQNFTLQYVNADSLVINIKKHKWRQYYSVSVPAVEKIYIESITENEDRYSSVELFVKGLKQENLYVNYLKQCYLNISNIEISKVNIKGLTQGSNNGSLRIENTANIKELDIDIKGSGSVDLKSVGQERNNLMISDSIDITMPKIIFDKLKK